MILRLSRFQLGKQLVRALIAALLMALAQVGALLVFDEGSIELLSQLRGGLAFPAAMLGLGGSATLSTHLASLCYGFLLPLLGFALVSSLSARLVAGQVETGEMAYYLALPLRRSAIIGIASVASLGLTLLALLFQMGITLLAAQILQPGALNISRYLLMNLGLLLQLMLAFGIAMIPASGGDDMRQARRQGRGLIALFWLISLLARPYQMPGWLRYLGLFSLVDQAALAVGRLSLDMWLLPLLAALCLLISIRRFGQRDLAL